ncbi:plasmid partitioning protein RepB [Paracraurococcus ruber]|uniref:Plasmid partitioning protein RepB n=1 Tax=Paracraurococcus ruber TaxID=77675 RepID=A0ABS1CQD6_9PROT|nr:plasmid partitioning protein RepB [Paracraurococcus ruber]MBK1656635.1 plasmid partitioning protein RepB [Paracraurococcus ruber]TDG33740.1 plasmid partitioning protein RepB [Paracraurococcus ruber]
MKRKDMLRALLTSTAATEDPPAPPVMSERRVGSGAVRAMGLDLDRLAQDARKAEALERQAANGQLVLDVDPALVDPSFAEDRVARTGDAEFRTLVESIRISGQQVPVLLRPHPEAKGRYQVAYGHRRVAAAAELGLPVRAMVRPMSDTDLVVAQGKENAERRNLSFIERALFAAELEARGFDRPTLMAALSAHPAEMSRYLSVARDIPRWVVRAIGPAPKAGRPRWLVLAGLLQADGAPETVRHLIEQPAFLAAATNRRFEMVIAALRRSPEEAKHGDPALVRAPSGEILLRLERDHLGLRITAVEQVAPGFCAFLEERLPDLVAEFHSQASLGDGDDRRDPSGA